MGITYSNLTDNRLFYDHIYTYIKLADWYTADYCVFLTVWWVRGVCPWGAADKWGAALRTPLALVKALVRRYLGPGSERPMRGTAGE